MLVGHNIIYFGDNWDGVLRNRQQLMSIFARQNKVLFVEEERHLRPTLARFRQGSLRWSDLHRPSVRQISENLFVYRHPVWAPVSGRFPLRRLTEIVRWLSLKAVMQKYRMSQPIVWFYHPDWINMIDRIADARLRLYHVIDDYAWYQDQTPASRRRIEELEKKMLSRVDAVIVVSQELDKLKRPFNSHTYVVPNGVNYQMYADALADPHIPDDLRAIPAPRLGHSGLVGNKLDLDILRESAQRHPEWSLVFLGHVNMNGIAEKWHALLALPNVYYLGAVEWSWIPYYVKGFDVGLIPYVQDREREHSSPLKLYDYLAAGLPIVSADIPSAREFSAYVHLVDSPQNFSRAVQAALADTTPERRQARRDAAAQHTWEARVEQISDLIQAELAAKTSRVDTGEQGLQSSGVFRPT